MRCHSTTCEPLDLTGAIQEIRNNKYYFIKNKDTIIGTVAYRQREDGSYYISNMAITSTYRGQGLARGAMQFIIKKCTDAWRIDLVTHPENFLAISLYKSFGFCIEKQVENYYGDGEPILIMATQPKNYFEESVKIRPLNS